MVLEEPVSPGFDHIRVTTVARRAGVTTGAVYHHWESQDHFRSELLDVIFEDFQKAHDDLLEEILASATESDDPVTVLERAVLAELGRLGYDKRFITFISLWGRRGEETVADRVAEVFRARNRRRAELLQSLMTGRGVVLQPPYTPESAAGLLSAYVDGVALRRGFDAATDPIEPGAEAVVAGLRALITRMVEGQVIDIDVEPGVPAADAASS